MGNTICAAVLTIYLFLLSSSAEINNNTSEVKDYLILTTLPKYSNDGEIDQFYNYVQRRIVGGNFVEILYHPYHVGYGLHCSGTIIHERWVLTAAHCGKSPNVCYATKYINSGRLGKVKRYIIHPGWNDSKKQHMFDYDFQLLELENRLFLDNYAQPIRLGKPGDLKQGNFVTITGWGLTLDQDRTHSQQLQAALIRVINTEDCQNTRFSHYIGKITDRMFCAGTGEKEQIKDACEGDSGGPAVANHRLVGVISFGYGCATPGAYGVYANVISVKDWIRGTTGIYFD